MAAFHTACASFVSRNWGAGNRKRMMKSYLVSLSYSFVSGAVLGGLLLAFGRQFLSFFANEPEGITAGMEHIKIMGCSYTISAFMDCTIAASRGMGKSVAPTITVILGLCVFRRSGSIRSLRISNDRLALFAVQLFMDDYRGG